MPKLISPRNGVIFVNSASGFPRDQSIDGVAAIFGDAFPLYVSQSVTVCGNHLGAVSSKINLAPDSGVARLFLRNCKYSFCQ